MVDTYTGDYGYTTSALLSQYIGEEGISLITDDLNPNLNDTTAVDSAIEKSILEAEDYMNQYLLNRYEPLSLQNLSWMERRCTELAVFFLFQRRGQDPPQSLHASVLRIQSDLENIMNAITMVPGAVTRLEPAPALSNYAIDNRLVRNRQRVVASQSMGTYPNQKQLRDHISDHDF